MALKMIEDLGGGAFRETDFNQPAHETETARFEALGPFRQINVAASQTTTKATLGGVDADALVQRVAQRGGTIVGVQIDAVGTITAGGAANAITATVLNGATALACTASVGSGDGAGPNRQTDLATPIEFAKGAKLGVQISSTAGLTPATIDVSAYILVRWAP